MDTSIFGFGHVHWSNIKNRLTNSADPGVMAHLDLHCLCRCVFVYIAKRVTTFTEYKIPVSF